MPFSSTCSKTVLLRTIAIRAYYIGRFGQQIQPYPLFPLGTISKRHQFIHGSPLFYNVAPLCQQGGTE